MTTTTKQKPKAARKTIPAWVVDMTGKELIDALIAAEVTQREIAHTAEVVESDVSRIRRGLRTHCSEIVWRALARLAIDRCSNAQLMEAASHGKRK